MPRFDVGNIYQGNDIDGLRVWIARELDKISETLAQMLENPKEQLHVEPTKKPHGLIVLADGTDWNPGSGQGMYWYNADTAAWTFMG